MPPRNVAVPNAVRLFNCTICDKGYPRQVDYENHLRSYDHNHRQRLAEMKKLTAANDTEGSRPKAGPDMRSISIEDANKKPGIGSRFTKIGGGGAAAGSRFKKVGVSVGGTAKSNDDANKMPEDQVKVPSEAQPKPGDAPKLEAVPAEAAPKIAATIPEPKKQLEAKKDEDIAMDESESEEEEISWEEYDFTKPTGCDHANCPGCQVKLDGIWDGKWVEVD